MNDFTYSSLLAAVLFAGKWKGYAGGSSMNHFTYRSLFANNRCTRCWRNWDASWPTVDEFAGRPLFALNFLAGVWVRYTCGPPVNHFTNGSHLALDLVTGRYGGNTRWRPTNVLTDGPLLTENLITGGLNGNTCGLIVHHLAYCPWFADGFMAAGWRDG